MKPVYNFWAGKMLALKNVLPSMSQCQNSSNFERSKRKKTNEIKDTLFS